MTSQKLAETNPYLRDPERAAQMILRSVASSSAVEGIRKPFRSKRVIAAAYEVGAPAEYPSDRKRR